MRSRTLITTAAAIVAASPVAFAVNVPNDFSAGQQASASEVNANFDALEQAITPLEGSNSTQFGSDYFISPSTSGQLTMRNVIVLREQIDTNDDGNVDEDVYRVRVYCENTKGVSIRTPSGSVTPDRLWIVGIAVADEGTTTATYAIDYKYAIPSSGSFAEADGIEINEDSNGDGSFETQKEFGYYLTRNSNPLSNTELVDSTEVYLDDSKNPLVVNSVTSTNSSLGRDLKVNAPLSQTFSDVMVRTLPTYSGLGYDGARVRFHAKGIGTVMEIDGAEIGDPLYSQQEKAKAIYYRIEGQGSKGSLSNTPFASGGSLDGEWFSQQ
jgi:hypothetical protein